MRIARLLLASVYVCCFAGAQEAPLTSLPYTPVLETAFMDKKADPCVNFYQYSCGKWSQRNPIPPDQATWDVYSKLNNENQRFLWGILQQAEQGGAARTSNEQKIGDLFHACMDESSIERAGVKPIEPVLAQIEQLPSKREIASFVAQQHVNGDTGGFLFGFGSGQDFDNSSSVIAFAAAGGLGLPDRDYYVKTDAKSQETRQRYVEHVAKMLALTGESVADAQSGAATVMRMETELAKASLTRVELRDPYNSKHKYSRAKLSSIAPDWNWEVYLTKVQTPSFEQINVTEPKFFEALNHEIQTESLAAWKAYLRWHLVHAEAQSLSSKFVAEDFDFYGKYLTGAKEMPARWKRCTRIVNRKLGEALGEVFVDKTFTPQTKADALKMTNEIEHEMEADIRELSWMSEPTKQQALTKLHGIVNKIGYPDRWRDYSSVAVSPDDFVGDMHTASSFEFHRDLNKIGKPVDRTEWEMTPPTVNAYYDPQMNDINFPAGVLEPPLFDVKSDEASNYGNTGATIGHELTHGFDDEGRQFDAKGDLKDWWTPADAKAFEQRVSCVRDQYAQYTVIDDIKINSKLTLGEDVADLGGTLLAYVAWKHATAEKKLEPIDGLTPDQRFFVGMAQWACGDARPEAKRLHALTDPHSPDEYRINGVVANLPEFGQAFSCKAGQPMMRERACRVW